MKDIISPPSLKPRLRRTWQIFFGRFGKLTPVQELTIPVVLDGKNAMVISATASGKTEAVVVPIIERFLQNRSEGLIIVYITPTRALVNDIYDRLKDQLEIFAITLERKTGDSPNLNWNKPPNFLITTPESLDSIICRHPNILSTVQYIILDEIHNIDGNYRGDQLRVLLRRFQKIVPEFKCYLLSATVADPVEVSNRYCSNAEVVSIGGHRTIKESYVPSLEQAYAVCREEKIHKVLIFCNSRRQTESVALEAKQLWGKNYVVVHHGSLHKDERFESEDVMKHQPKAVCVATMTLEIGIDIGSIEAVILAEIPITISSLIQRIGRAGRRSGVIRVIGICDDEGQDTLVEMLRLARENILNPKTYHPDISVTVQQLFSVLFAKRAGISIDEFLTLVKDMVDPDEFRHQILPFLVEQEMIEVMGDRVIGSETMLNLGERGSIHSNIPDTKTYTVKNSHSNRIVGNIDLPKNFKEQAAFVLAGKIWEIVRVEKNTVYVRPGTKSALPASFKMSQQTGAFFSTLPKEIQEREMGKMNIG